MVDELLQAANEKVLRRLAGVEAYARGEDYFFHGHVASIKHDAGSLQALVRGKQDYAVRLSAEDGMLDYSCNCPVGAEGIFCKHCVAAGLAWLKQSGQLRTPKTGRTTQDVTLANARSALLEEDKETIVETVFEWAKTDKRLRERLLLNASRRLDGQASLAAVERAANRAIRIRGFVHYRDMPSYARRVHDAIDSIERLLESGQPAGVIGLCERTLAALQETIEQVDDSDGHMRELLDRLQAIHYRACLEARPEPVALAERLFYGELRSEYDIFCNAVARYREILGPTGMQRYQTLAEEEWAKVPVQRSNDRHSWGKYFRITRMMEALATLSGDLHALVSVMSRDLSSAYQYLRIAEACRDDGELDQGLEWAERGLRAFPERTDYRLREFLADEYHRRNRHDEAMRLIWAAFDEHSGLESYEHLQQHATRYGNWEAWRQQALEEIRRRIARRKTAEIEPGRSWMRPPAADHSLLVQIFLYEGDAESAWREAQTGGCESPLWVRLADVRQKDHPEDAAPIYLKHAELALITATSSKYDPAVELLVKAGAAMKRIGRRDEFVGLVAALRAKYKVKRNFVKLLDEHKEAFGLL